MSTEKRSIQHLLLRAGFGAKPEVIDRLSKKNTKHAITYLFKSSETFTDLDHLANPIKGKKEQELSKFKIVLQILRSRKQLKELNVAWLNKMATDQAQLREKMTLFWHNHFATKVPFAYLMQVQNNTLRKNAMVGFGQLLHAVARDPAMLIFLNNHQNRKNAPNENFARELMELFTLGEGHYSEHDIKEAARAFTGWQVSRRGKFYFNQQQHDYGVKEFLGRKGKFDGGDIIDILLEEKQTATYITTKIYREFVSTTTDDKIISLLADKFYRSNYDIQGLLKDIFTADWFYDEGLIGTKIVSPVELIVRYKKLFDLEFSDSKHLIGGQKIMGQMLFFPPNVAGWPGGKSWIDSSSLLFRMNLPKILLNDNRLAKADWKPVLNAFKKYPPADLNKEIMNSFIQNPDLQAHLGTISSYQDLSSLESKIKSTVIMTMSLPEFQLI